MPVTNLNLAELLRELHTNPQPILAAIDADPMLSKRICTKTGLTIANASKSLFTPTEQWQLYAKGIVYKKWRNGFNQDQFTLVAVPFLKMFNHGEGEHVDRHVASCIAAGALPVFTDKHDGTFIMRTVVDNRVILSTRGMLDTMHDLLEREIAEVDTDFDGRFFEWAWDIINKKYPVLKDPNFHHRGPLYFELVGPGNRIVTSYDEWDLILIGGLHVPTQAYFTYESLKAIADGRGLRVTEANVVKLPSFDQCVDHQLGLYCNSDFEGTVIQFEKGGIVIGRVKAKTETYRTIATLLNHCSFAHTAELIEKDPVKYGRSKWQAFKEYLISLGRKKVQEEFLELYREHHQAYWQHQADVDAFIKGCYQYATILRLQLQVPGIGKPAGEFKKRIFETVNAKSNLHKKQYPDAAGYFSKYVLMAVDGVIDRKTLIGMHLKTPAIAAECRSIVEYDLEVQSEYVRTDLLMLPLHELTVKHQAQTIKDLSAEVKDLVAYGA